MRTRFSEALVSQGHAVENEPRSSVRWVFGEHDAMVLISGQSSLGTVYDLVAATFGFLVFRRVVFYIHNASWKRLRRIPFPGVFKNWGRVRVLVLRPAIAGSFAQAGIKAVVLNNSIDRELEACGLSHISEPRKRLLWMGRPDAAKGFPKALEAFGILRGGDPEWVFDVYGQSADVAPAPRIDGVVFHGFVSGKQKELALQGGGIFILPSQYKNETQPLSIIEALAFGIPILASDVGGIPEMIEGDGWSAGHVIHSGAPIDYANAAIEVVGRYRKYSEAARKVYLESYGTKVFEESVRDLALDLV